MKEYFAKFLEYWKEGLALVAAPALIGVVLCQEKKIQTLKHKLKEERQEKLDSQMMAKMWELAHIIDHIDDEPEEK